MEDLPDEIKVELLTKVNESSLVNVSVLNKSWMHLTSDESLWRRLYYRRWHPSDDSLHQPSNWKASFRRRYTIDKNWKNGGQDLIDCAARVSSILFNEEYLVVGGWRSSIHIRQMNNLHEAPRKIQFMGSKLSAVDLHPKLNSLCAVALEWNVRLIDLQPNSIAHPIDTFSKIPSRQLECTGWIETIQFSCDGSKLHIANGNQIRILDLASGSDQLIAPKHLANVLSFSCGNRLLASGSLDRSVCIWDLRSSSVAKECVAHLLSPANQRSAVRSVYLDESLQRVVTPYALNKTLAVWDLRQPNTPMCQLTLPSGVNRMKVSAGGRTILGHMNGDVRILSTNALLRGDISELDRTTRLIASRHSSRVEGLCANLTQLASASAEELIVTNFE